MAGQSVLDFLQQHGELIQQTSKGQDIRVPKADGGYDFYRILPDGSISAISAKDVGGGMNPPISPKVPDAPTPQVLGNNTNNGGRGGGSSGGGGSAVLPYNETFLGVNYTDPSQALGAKMNFLRGLYQTKLGNMDTSRNQAVGDNPNVDYNNVGGSYGDQKTSFLNSIKDAYNSIASYFSGLGDISQSSEGVRNAQTADKQTTGENSLKTALSNYLTQDSQGRNDLATQYLQAQDTLANANESSLQNALSSSGISASQVNLPSVQNAPINTAAGQAGALSRAQQQFMNQPTAPNGVVDPNAILKYLYGQA